MQVLHYIISHTHPVFLHQHTSLLQRVSTTLALFVPYFLFRSPHMTFSSLFSVILVATTAVASPLISQRSGSPNSVQVKFKTNSGGVANIIITRDRARLNVIGAKQSNTSNGLKFGSPQQLDASVPVAESGVSLFFTVFINLNLTHLFSSYRQFKFKWEILLQHIN